MGIEKISYFNAYPPPQLFCSFENCANQSNDRGFKSRKHILATPLSIGVYYLDALVLCHLRKDERAIFIHWFIQSLNENDFTT